MPVSDESFCFAAEKEPALFAPAVDQTRQLMLFFVLLLVACVAVITGMSIYSYSGVSRGLAWSGMEGSLNSGRARVSATGAVSPGAELKPLALDSFLVRLAGESIRLSKIDIVLLVSDPAVGREIQSSMHRVRNHLVFILSAQKAVAFMEREAREILEKQIIQQLNLFLVAGRVADIELRQTFL